jgi:hypothetical protein
MVPLWLSTRPALKHWHIPTSRHRDIESSSLVPLASTGRTTQLVLSRAGARAAPARAARRGTSPAAAVGCPSGAGDRTPAEPRLSSSSAIAVVACGQSRTTTRLAASSTSSPRMSKWTSVSPAIAAGARAFELGEAAGSGATTGRAPPAVRRAAAASCRCRARGDRSPCASGSGRGVSSAASSALAASMRASSSSRHPSAGCVARRRAACTGGRIASADLVEVALARIAPATDRGRTRSRVDQRGEDLELGGLLLDRRA